MPLREVRDPHARLVDPDPYPDPLGVDRAIQVDQPRAHLVVIQVPLLNLGEQPAAENVRVGAPRRI